ncbi:hypothetical protein SAMN04488074_13630 [Lentzea albidocapillata subsp. violacea]|uniref:Helix-turn-helix domain-containing protein n=1 Tax=Lentzea albidocapillata subsp. violacea TaxID=128104 RepID=A0A1G9YYE9_9PSEU|nr:helix-turn-helix transcriptional regulator [Lentzea albidocapillata]SDN14140.1 hypothetical protein SAMN04488074_13630 [Lentzea albidocapillata subsp. violacea]
MQITSAELDVLKREIGALLLAARKARKWTRRELRDAMNAGVTGEDQGDATTSSDGQDDDVTVPCTQTLATWELGTRNMTINRFVEVCAVLGVPADEVLRRALARMAIPSGRSGVIEVDRHKLARSTSRAVKPLQRWLGIRDGHRTPLDTRPSPDFVELPPAALKHLAALAEVPIPELIRALRDLVTDRS